MMAGALKRYGVALASPMMALLLTGGCSFRCHQRRLPLSLRSPSGAGSPGGLGAVVVVIRLSPSSVAPSSDKGTRVLPRQGGEGAPDVFVGARRNETSLCLV